MYGSIGFFNEIIYFTSLVITLVLSLQTSQRILSNFFSWGLRLWIPRQDYLGYQPCDLRLTLGRQLNLPVPQLPQPYNRDNNTTCFLHMYTYIPCKYIRYILRLSETKMKLFETEASNYKQNLSKDLVLCKRTLRYLRAFKLDFRKDTSHVIKHPELFQISWRRMLPTLVFMTTYSRTGQIIKQMSPYPDSKCYLSLRTPSLQTGRSCPRFKSLHTISS